MRRFSIALIMIAAVAACSTTRRPDIESSASALPPIGLAASARWLEKREAAAPRPVAARDIPTSQIRNVVSGGAPVAATSAAATPARGKPSGTVALAAQAFADTCVASLPDMSGVADRLAQVSQRDFGVAPNQAARGYYLTGQRRGNIFMNLSLNAGRPKTNQCAASVRREDPAAVAQALVDTVTNAGFALTPVASDNAAQAWSISGARAGMVLKTSTKTNAQGQNVTGVWITWP